MDWDFIESKMNTLQKDDLWEFLSSDEIQKGKFSVLIKIADHLRLSRKFIMSLDFTGWILEKCWNRKQLATLLYVRGDIYMDSYRYKEAIICYSLLTEIGPQDTMDIIYNNRGVAHWELGEHEAAMRDFQESIKLNPVNKYALYGAGEMHLIAKAYDEAIKCFQRVLAIDSKYAYTSEGMEKCLKAKSEITQ